MAMYLFYGLYWFLMCLLLAVVEIFMEGPHGWASGTQTPYRTTGRAAWFYATFLANGKPLSFWNLGMQAFLFMFAHSIFTFVPCAGDLELRVLVRCTWGAIIWDYIWFVLNPHHNPDGANTWNWPRLFEKAWWHARKHASYPLRGLPTDYRNQAIFIAIYLGLLGHFYRPKFARQEVVIMACMLGGSIIISAVLVRPFQRWYLKALKNDERAKIIPISHYLPGQSDPSDHLSIPAEPEQLAAK